MGPSRRSISPSTSSKTIPSSAWAPMCRPSWTQSNGSFAKKSSRAMMTQHSPTLASWACSVVANVVLPELVVPFRTMTFPGVTTVCSTAPLTGDELGDERGLRVGVLGQAADDRLLGFAAKERDVDLDHSLDGPHAAGAGRRDARFVAPREQVGVVVGRDFARGVVLRDVDGRVFDPGQVLRVDEPRDRGREVGLEEVADLELHRVAVALVEQHVG